MSYKYNADGIRYEKTVNGVVHKYFLMGSTITAETIVNGNTTTKLEYFYDDTGVYAFTYDGTMYYYVKNLQGDVTQLRDASNNLVVSYTYDAWGKLMSTTGSLASTVGATNPIRYRGYYYDTESGFYYLNSRYYDPEIKRFINPDTLITTGQGIIGNNMFTYCDNNPVVHKDTEGLFWETVFDVVSLAFSVADVVANPTDPWAWAGLVGDALDLIPFVTGLGEITKAIGAIDDVVDAVDNIYDTVKAVDNVGDIVDTTYDTAKVVDWSVII